MILLGALLLSVFVFYYTGNREGDEVKKLVAATEQQLNTLESNLADKKLKNALILTAYAERLKTLKPEFVSLADQLEKDASSTGPGVTALKTRLEKVKTSPSSVGDGSKEALVRELMVLQNAADSNRYNDFLLEDINVIAGLSGGALPVIAPPQGQKTEVGSQLVGNPTYGQWQQRDGMSVWEWYGAYSMLRDLVGGGRSYFYNDWAGSRNNYGHYQGGDYNSYSAGKGIGKSDAANDNIRQEKTYGTNQDRRKSSYSTGSSSSNKSIWGSNKKSSYGGSTVRRSSSFGSSRKK